MLLRFDVREERVMSGPKVFITAYDPTKNLRGAAAFGTPTYLLKTTDVGDALPLYIPELREKLKEIRPTDFLLLVGDPLLIATVAALAAYYCEGKVAMLKWDRQTREYFPVKLDLNAA
jgi:hypothetical protein